MGVIANRLESFRKLVHRLGPVQHEALRVLVASEHSSGNRVQRGKINKTGHWHLRRVLVEAAWAYQHRPNVTVLLERRQKTLALSEEVKKIAWKALPTDHDHAVPTREYQSDRSSRLLLGCHPPCCPGLGARQ
jgi:hypothetical protein